MSFPVYLLPTLPTTTIVPSPKEEMTYIQYFMRLYEEIANTVNAKDNNFFTIPISDVASNIPNIPNFGAFIVCVSGVDSGQPTTTYSLCKSDSNASGATGILQLSFQAGTGAWLGNLLTITSTATNFQIAHDRANETANFNIRIIGTK